MLVIPYHTPVQIVRNTKLYYYTTGLSYHLCKYFMLNLMSMRLACTILFTFVLFFKDQSIVYIYNTLTLFKRNVVFV